MKILLAVAVIAAFVIGARAQKKLDARPQVVFVYDHKLSDGTYIVIPQGRVIIAIKQSDSDAKLAPLSKGTLMLCRPYNEGAQYKLRCGFDKFDLTGIDFQPEY